MLRNQKGFTLIEIIAVLVILGILAAVAIPKYFDMQGQAQDKAIQGALAALSSETSQDYAKQLIANPPTASATSYTPTAATVTVGDFTGTIANTDRYNNDHGNGRSVLVCLIDGDKIQIFQAVLIFVHPFLEPCRVELLKIPDS